MISNIQTLSWEMHWRIIVSTSIFNTLNQCRSIKLTFEGMSMVCLTEMTAMTDPKKTKQLKDAESPAGHFPVPVSGAQESTMVILSLVPWAQGSPGERTLWKDAMNINKRCDTDLKENKQQKKEKKKESSLRRFWSQLRLCKAIPNLS